METTLAENDDDDEDGCDNGAVDGTFVANPCRVPCCRRAFPFLPAVPTDVEGLSDITMIMNSFNLLL